MFCEVRSFRLVLRKTVVDDKRSTHYKGALGCRSLFFPRAREESRNATID